MGPAASERFTRVQRATCCVLLLGLFLGANAVWYGTVGDSAHRCVLRGPTHPPRPPTIASPQASPCVLSTARAPHPAWPFQAWTPSPSVWCLAWSLPESTWPSCSSSACPGARWVRGAPEHGQAVQGGPRGGVNTKTSESGVNGPRGYVPPQVTGQAGAGSRTTGQRRVLRKTNPRTKSEQSGPARQSGRSLKAPRTAGGLAGKFLSGHGKISTSPRRALDKTWPEPARDLTQRSSKATRLGQQPGRLSLALCGHPRLH